METFEANKKTECRLQLCQSDLGLRSFVPLDEISYEERKLHPDAYFVTLPVPYDLARRKLFSAISQRYLLDNGLRFFVDAHNFWLTESEVRQLDDFERSKISKIEWSTRATPSFAPK